MPLLFFSLSAPPPPVCPAPPRPICGNVYPDTARPGSPHVRCTDDRNHRGPCRPGEFLRPCADGCGRWAAHGADVCAVCADPVLPVARAVDHPCVTCGGLTNRTDGRGIWACAGCDAEEHAETPVGSPCLCLDCGGARRRPDPEVR